MGAGDHLTTGDRLRQAGDRVHGHVGRAAGGSDQGKPDAEAGQADRSQRKAGSDDTQSAEDPGRDLEPPPIQRPADEQHRGQRAGAHEQQREPELAVGDVSTVLDPGHRRAPGSPECAKGGEGHERRGDQAAG